MGKIKITFNNIEGFLKLGFPLYDIFDEVEKMTCGLIHVKLQGKHNFVDKYNRLLSNVWFDDYVDFKYDVARVKLNNKWNLLNIKGEILCKKWYEMIFVYKAQSLTKVKDEFGYNFLDKDGNLLLDIWVDEIDFDREEIYRVWLNNKNNFVNFKGELISEQWFDSAGQFYQGKAHVNLNGKCNYIDKNGVFLSKEWYDDIDLYGDETKGGVVLNNNKINFIDSNFNLLLTEWVDEFEWLTNETLLLTLNNKYNVFNINGNVLSSEQWFDFITGFTYGYALVELNGKYNIIDEQGKFKYDTWKEQVIVGNNPNTLENE